MKCIFCKQTMNKVTTSTTTKWGDYEITIKGLPAYECPECGEKIFSSSTVDIIQGLAAGLADNTDPDKPDTLNVTETAEMLRVTKQTIYNMLKDGRLIAKKIGREWRFEPAVVRRLLPESTVEIAARGNEITANNANIVKDIVCEK